MTQDELAALETIGLTIHRAAGEPFFLEGEPGDFALLIRKGHVKVLVGRPPSIVALRGPGEIVGEMAAIRRMPRSASIIALTEVDALYLPAGQWLKFLHDHPRAMRAQWATAADRTEQATRKIVQSELAVGQQLAIALVELADSGFGESTPEGAVVLRRLTQQDLAMLVGARKLDSVKKVIGVLKADGIIATGRQLLTILDLASLRSIASGDLTADRSNGVVPGQ